MTLYPGEVIGRIWDLEKIFEFNVTQEYTMSAGFFFVWWNLDDELLLDNAQTHVINSEMIKIDVTEIETFVSRKLSSTFTVSDSGSNVSTTQYIGTEFSCSSANTATVKTAA